MSFWIAFIALNFVSFLPMYLLNFREQKNPFACLIEIPKSIKKILILGLRRIGYTDPFRLNFEFSLVLLLCLVFDIYSGYSIALSAFVLVLSEIYLIYICIMLFIFKRPPFIMGDITLLKSGIVIFKRQRFLILSLVLAFIGLLYIASYFAIAYLISLYVPNFGMTVSVIAILIFMASVNWWNLKYETLHWRTVFSLGAHLYRNLQIFKERSKVIDKDAAFYQNQNEFSELNIQHKPNIVFLCIESYGAIVYRDETISNELTGMLKVYEEQLGQHGFSASSTLSTAPIYSGGSWLSYATFMYGLKIDNIGLYETLFTIGSNFNAYDSIFHLLKNNSYHNSLLCPMGGVNSKDIDWASINRLFQSNSKFDWNSIGYKGQTTPFFAQKDRYCLPDQYAINYAYNELKQSTAEPFSLFFCTMNSHIPYETPLQIAPNWQDLNSPSYNYSTNSRHKGKMKDRYLEAIKYQLDMALDFVLKNKDDDIVLVLFGDHQPPLVSSEKMGLETPVHVISKHAAFAQTFEANNFISGLQLKHHDTSIKHEGFMSVFANACNNSFSDIPDKNFPNRPDGNSLFQDSDID
jgi:hypothetical protein